MAFFWLLRPSSLTSIYNSCPISTLSARVGVLEVKELSCNYNLEWLSLIFFLLHWILLDFSICNRRNSSVGLIYTLKFLDDITLSPSKNSNSWNLCLTSWSIHMTYQLIENTLKNVKGRRILNIASCGWGLLTSHWTLWYGGGLAQIECRPCSEIWHCVIVQYGTWRACSSVSSDHGQWRAISVLWLRDTITVSTNESGFYSNQISTADFLSPFKWYTIRMSLILLPGTFNKTMHRPRHVPWF